ncbi:MAG: HesA/MoeB/ThiF family protein [Pseudomonadota bacterium]
MTSDGTTRYHGHLALDGFDERSQERLSQARVLLVGLGGVGSPAVQYLAAAGIGELRICDFDRVSESNLSRQLLYRQQDVDRPKTEAASEALKALNPTIKITTTRQRIDTDKAADIGGDCTLWLDTSDSWATRMAINEAALRCRTPWVMAAAVRREGQLALFRPDLGPNEACYACIYGRAANTMDDCAGAGVLSTVAGSVGLAAAQLAINHLIGAPTPRGLQLFDGNSLRWRGVALARDPDCRVC